MANLNITTDDLKEMIGTAVAAAITESRKPNPPTEQEVAQLQMAQEHRANTAESLLAQKENERAIQRMCSHEHSKREGGGTHCVWVKEEDPTSPGYIYCQKCQAKIRPQGGNQGTKREDRNAHYDTMLFNKLFQDCGEQALMG